MADRQRDGAKLPDGEGDSTPEPTGTGSATDEGVSGAEVDGADDTTHEAANADGGTGSTGPEADGAAETTAAEVGVEAGAPAEGGAAQAGPGGVADEVISPVVPDFEDKYQRLLADFDNYKKRSTKQLSEEIDRAAGRIVEGLLAVLDACDAATQHGADGVEPIGSALMVSLGREGLERMEPEGQPFDPEHHDAVMHEPGDGDAGPHVSSVLRAGYLWRGRVLRPAMVQVKD